MTNPKHLLLLALLLVLLMPTALFAQAPDATPVPDTATPSPVTDAEAVTDTPDTVLVPVAGGALPALFAVQSVWDWVLVTLGVLAIVGGFIQKTVDSIKPLVDDTLDMLNVTGEARRKQVKAGVINALTLILSIAPMVLFEVSILESAPVAIDLPPMLQYVFTGGAVAAAAAFGHHIESWLNYLGRPRTIR